MQSQLIALYSLSSMSYRVMLAMYLNCLAISRLVSNSCESTSQSPTKASSLSKCDRRTRSWALFFLLDTWCRRDWKVSASCLRSFTNFSYFLCHFASLRFSSLLPNSRHDLSHLLLPPVTLPCAEVHCGEARDIQPQCVSHDNRNSHRSCHENGALFPPELGLSYLLGYLLFDEQRGAVPQFQLEH